MADDIDQYLAQKGASSQAQSAGVSPPTALRALNDAPVTGVPASVGMHDPTPLAQLADQQRNANILRTSPQLSSFVASDPAKGAAIGDSYDPFARAGFLAQRWKDVTQPARDYLTRLGQAWDAVQGAARPGDEQTAPTGTDLSARFADFLGMKPVTIGEARRGEAANVSPVFEGLITGLNTLTNPLAAPAARAYGRNVTLRPGETREEVTKGANEAFNFGLQAIAPAAMAIGQIKVPWYYRGVIDEGTFGAQPRLPGPREPIIDAEFEPIKPPGVSPMDDAVHSAVAEMDVVHVQEMQGAVAEAPSHARANALTTDFLQNHTSIGDQFAYVPVEALAKIWDAGGQEFADHQVAAQRALGTGEDVAIPLGQYISESAGKPWQDELNSATRFREDGVSVDEGKELGSAGAERAPTQVTPPEDIGPEHTSTMQAMAARADDVVSQVFKETALDSLFTEPKAAGMEKGLFERYGAAVEEARNAVHERLLQRAYDQIRRERTPEWKAAVDLRAEEVTSQIEAMRSVRAYRDLRGVKLDRDAVALHHPDLRVPDGLMKRGGLTPDEAAELTGYGSGAELVADMHDLGTAIDAAGGTLDKYIKLRARTYAEEQARRDVGFDVSRESLLRAAREAVADPKIEDLLVADLREVGARLGIPLDREAVTAAAEANFNQLPLSAATKPKAFAENMRRLGNKAEKAIFDGKDIEAFTAKQQQLLQFHQMKMAFALQKEVGKAEKAIRVVAKKPINAGMDQTARNHLRAIAEQLGFPVRTKNFEGVQEALKGQTLSDYGAVLTGRGTPVYITDVPAPFGQLNVEQFHDVWNMWQSIANLGRMEKKVYSEGRAAELAQIVQEVRENATAIGRRYTAAREQRAEGKVTYTQLLDPAQRELLAQKVSQGASRALRALGAASVRNETALYWLDNETFGPLMRYMVAPLNERANWKVSRLNEMGQEFRKFVAGQPKGWDKSLDLLVNIPELTYGRDVDGQPIPWLRNRGNVIRAALHMGTEENWAKLVEGFGWDPATVERAIMQTLTPADWDYVQFLWNANDKLWPEVKDLYRATTGLAPKAVPGRSVTLPDGRVLKGKYWHLSYNWGAIGDDTAEGGEAVRVSDPMSLGVSDLFGEQYQLSTPPNGSTKARTQFRGPLDLNHATLHKELEAVVHDLAFRKELIQAAKMLRQQGVRTAIREALGPEWVGATERWLKDIAQASNYDKTALDGLSRVFSGIRRRFVIVQIGANVATVLKHGGVAALHMLHPDLPKAAWDIHTNREYWSKFIDDNSPEVRNVMMNVDRDLQSVLRELFKRQGFVDTAQYYSTVMFGFVKRWEAQMTWLANYRQAVRGQMDDGAAFALADKAVRDTQGTANSQMMAALQRGGNGAEWEILKLFNAFTTFMNTQTNRLWTVARRGQRLGEQVKSAVGGTPIAGFQDEGWAGARRDFAKNFADLMQYWVLPATWIALFEIGSHSHGDKEKFFKKLKKEFVQLFTEHAAEGALGGTVPGGNILAEVPRMWAHHKFEAPDDPLGSMVATVGNAAYDGWEAANGRKVKDSKWPEHAINTAGYITGLPVKPATRAGQFWWDKENNKVEDDGAMGLLTAVLFGNAAAKKEGR